MLIPAHNYYTAVNVYLIITPVRFYFLLNYVIQLICFSTKNVMCLMTSGRCFHMVCYKQDLHWYRQNKAVYLFSLTILDNSVAQIKWNVEDAYTWFKNHSNVDKYTIKPKNYIFLPQSFGYFCFEESNVPWIHKNFMFQFNISLLWKRSVWFIKSYCLLYILKEYICS